MSLQDSSIVTGGAFTSGYFEFKKLKADKYLLQVSCVGYQKVNINVSCLNNMSLDIGIIRMDNISLDQINIIAKRPVFRQNEGKLVIDVKGTVLSEAGDLFDVMRRSPGLIVDNDNNITVFGKGSPIVFINNREVTNKTELKSLRSDDISSFEIDRNPSAEYSASGMAVVRIKTKKITKDQLRLQIYNQTYLLRKTSTVSGVKLINKTGKTKIYVDYSFKNGNYVVPMNSYETIHYPDYLTNNVRNLTRKINDKKHKLFVNLNHEIDKKHKLGVQYSLSMLDANQYNYGNLTN